MNRHRTFLKRILLVSLIPVCVALSGGLGWSAESHEKYEQTLTPHWAQHKTFFIDTSASPTRKDVTITMIVDELTTGDKQCSGKVDFQYLVDVGEPYTGGFTITKCGTHRISTGGRVRYVNFRFINDEEMPAKLRISVAFSWQEK